MAVALVLGVGVGVAGAAPTGPQPLGAPGPAPEVHVAALAGPPLVSNGIVDRGDWGDIDGDAVPDRVEEALCGLGTCASPSDDADGDGIADWVEYLACGGATCADPFLDTAGDAGVPDYVELVLCGRVDCGAGVLGGDVDADGIANWVEVVVGGDAYTATGAEDLNHNQVSDAVELDRGSSPSPPASSNPTPPSGGPGDENPAWPPLSERSLYESGAVIDGSIPGTVSR
ncbi:MAG: hypothetical protein LBJ08_11690 [Bifidobacteriaceae bacterium]|jgi:hypothetical protein|nr:hypothetical protein [Bifidobacteriaceae bacterium]